MVWSHLKPCFLHLHKPPQSALKLMEFGWLFTNHEIDKFREATKDWEPGLGSLASCWTQLCHCQKMPNSLGSWAGAASFLASSTFPALP